MDIFEGKDKFKLTEEDINKIFTANVDDLVEMCYPHYEGQCKLFEFFGTRTGGICDNWIFTKNWKDYPAPQFIKEWVNCPQCNKEIVLKQGR